MVFEAHQEVYQEIYQACLERLGILRHTQDCRSVDGVLCPDIYLDLEGAKELYPPDYNLVARMEGLLETWEQWQIYAGNVLKSILPPDWRVMCPIGEIVRDTDDFTRFVRAAPITKLLCILGALEWKPEPNQVKESE